MIAFHGKQEIKEFFLNRVKAHALADEIIKGKYWENGKGCAIGCTIHSLNHKAYEIELGIPEWLARVEDTIFENLPNDRSKLWPEEFLDAIAVGVDLEKVKTPFLIFILEDCLQAMKDAKFDSEKFPEITKVIEESFKVIREVINLHKTGSDLPAALSAALSASRSAVESAESAFWAASASALSASRSAVESAESASASAARSAVESAFWAARSVAWSVRSAAESASASAARSAVESAFWAARSAESAAMSAWSAASASASRSAAYVKFADHLLDILRMLEK